MMIEVQMNIEVKGRGKTQEEAMWDLIRRLESDLEDMKKAGHAAKILQEGGWQQPSESEN
jgi:translation initiation factor IF-3